MLSLDPPLWPNKKGDIYATARASRIVGKTLRTAPSTTGYAQKRKYEQIHSRNSLR